MACLLYMLVVAKPKLQPPFPSPTKPLSGSFLLFHCQQPSPCEYSRAASLRLYALPSPKVSSAKRVMALAKSEPLRVMISGAPAPGEGTRCELITEKDGLVHIAAGDLLRAEVAAGTENGRQTKEFMDKGQLVPNEIVVMMVKERLLQPDSLEIGWFLDGYPQSSSQDIAQKKFGFQPDIFILLELSIPRRSSRLELSGFSPVPEEILVERVAGRRLDLVTGKTYHLKYSPPGTEEIAAEKVKLRLRTHHQNMEALLSVYEDITVKVNGDASKEEVCKQIDNALAELVEQKKAIPGSVAAYKQQNTLMMVNILEHHF